MNEPLHRKLRMALIGGGGAAFIGPIHVIAATLDQRAELVAGAFSSDPGRSRAAAQRFGIDGARAYDSWAALLRDEARLPSDQRAEFVAIATPNHTHFAIAQAALQAGFHVVCEKPLTIDLDEAATLAELVDRTGAVFAVAHGYAGHPTVCQARAMIAGGELGNVQAVRVQYLQGGLRGQQPGVAPARGGWKSNPALAGPAGTLADIGTHAFHLLRYVAGLLPVEITCQLKSFFPERQLDDYAHVVLRLTRGALGTITVSQVTHGRLNDLIVEVDGTTGSLQWRQEDAERLTLRRHGQPVQVYERNARGSVLHASARQLCRLPGGHAEGFLEAFANLYRGALDAMVAQATGQRPVTPAVSYPDVRDGVEGVEFVTRCLESHQENGAWKAWSNKAGRSPS
jgi:predicted dehydrogenase